VLKVNSKAALPPGIHLINICDQLLQANEKPILETDNWQMAFGK